MKQIMRWQEVIWLATFLFTFGCEGDHKTTPEGKKTSNQGDAFIRSEHPDIEYIPGGILVKFKSDAMIATPSGRNIGTAKTFCYSPLTI